jgi:hypothetical protein
MGKYLVKLKRKGAEDVEIEVESGKFKFKKNEQLFAPVETAAVIINAIAILEKEGLSTLEIEEIEGSS